MNIQTAAKKRLRQDPQAPGFVQNPYKLYRQLHASGAPVFWEDYGFWCLSSFDSVNGVLRDRRFARLVTECLRFAAPLHMFTRYAQETVTLPDGTQINAGEEVCLLLAAANRCPVRFTEPDTFNPKRTDAGQISLGAGLHFCVGAQLAKLELRIALQVLFERLPDLQLTDKPQYQDAYHFHGLQRLQVSWD